MPTVPFCSRLMLDSPVTLTLLMEPLLTTSISPSSEATVSFATSASGIALKVSLSSLMTMLLPEAYSLTVFASLTVIFLNVALLLMVALGASMTIERFSVLYFAFSLKVALSSVLMVIFVYLPLLSAATSSS